MSTSTHPAAQTMTELQFLHYLAELGIIREVRPPLPPEMQRVESPPIVVQGKPISEEIIEARR